MCVLPSGEKQADNGRTDTPVHQTRGEHSREMLVGRPEFRREDRVRLAEDMVILVVRTLVVRTR